MHQQNQPRYKFGRTVRFGCLSLVGLVVFTLVFPVSTLAQPAAAILDLAKDCETPSRSERIKRFGLVPDPTDCSSDRTSPTEEYAPDEVWEIPLVFQVLMDSDCNVGALSDEVIESQVEVLNEDFRAIFGTPGEFGNDSRVRFVLAATDPDGNPTNGIVRTCNSDWYKDQGDYYNFLSWDPNRYVNLYTVESFSGGYVPFLPADAGGQMVGSAEDRIVVTWRVVGRNPWSGPPNDMGRTVTHEVGHYLGLEHTFSGGCSDSQAPACYRSGDLICDTASEQFSAGAACEWGEQVSCGTIDPTDNYMDYSDDRCLRRYTPEQVRRVRCTLAFYRPDVYTVVGPGPTIDIDSVSPAIAGVVNDWNISGATPGGDVSAVCNLKDSPVLITVGEAVADLGGGATLSRVIPAAGAGRTIECRAIDEASNEQSLRLEVVFGE